MKDSITARIDACKLGFVKLFAVIPADKMVTRKRRKLAPDKIITFTSCADNQVRDNVNIHCTINNNKTNTYVVLFIIFIENSNNVKLMQLV